MLQTIAQGTALGWDLKVEGAGAHQPQTGLYSEHVSKGESAHPSVVFPAYKGKTLELQSTAGGPPE